MHITTERWQLQLINPFKIAHGTSTMRDTVIIRISDGTHTGIGEAAIVPYYGESAERIEAYCAAQQLAGDHLQDWLAQLTPGDSSAARAGMDMALHDLWGKRLGQPLHQLWGLNPQRCPVSTLTIAMAEDEASYRVQLRQAAAFPLIKLKLGSGDIEQDRTFYHIARQTLPTTQFCIDANSAWTVEETLAILPDVEDAVFIEQPLHPDHADWQALRQHPTPPIIADESVQGVDSVLPLVEHVDGINIKLVKCGGIQPAQQMIAIARAAGLRVMIGCMVESSVALSAAAQLAPLADYVDLDASLLIANDPFSGFENRNGHLVLPMLPGLGINS